MPRAYAGLFTKIGLVEAASSLLGFLGAANLPGEAQGGVLCFGRGQAGVAAGLHVAGGCRRSQLVGVGLGQMVGVQASLTSHAAAPRCCRRRGAAAAVSDGAVLAGAAGAVHAAQAPQPHAGAAGAKGLRQGAVASWAGKTSCLGGTISFPQRPCQYGATALES